MRTSKSQFKSILEFMERNGDLSKPAESPQGRIRNARLWAKLVKLLNMNVTGEKKTLNKWKKVWSDLKTKTKRKAAKINLAASGTGRGPSSRLCLSDLEQRVLSIIGSQFVTGVVDKAEIVQPNFEMAGQVQVTPLSSSNTLTDIKSIIQPTSAKPAPNVVDVSAVSNISRSSSRTPGEHSLDGKPCHTVVRLGIVMRIVHDKIK